MEADDLRMGDQIRQADGTTGTVWLKWEVHKTKEMYNLTVDTAHTFYVGEGQWLVHNACPKIPRGIPTDKPIVVVGEGMVDRVNPAAKILSDAGYDVHTWPANKFRGGVNKLDMEADRSWLRYWTNKGATVIDLGLEKGRDPLKRGAYYLMENRSLYKNWKYPNIIKWDFP